LSDFYSSQVRPALGFARAGKIAAKNIDFFAENPLFLAGVADQGTRAGSFRHSPYVLSHRRMHHANHTCRSIVRLATSGR
jgi:hypothetical protein